MTFQLPEDVPNLPDALRAAEPQAPKQMKALLLQAANELCDWHRVARTAVELLDNTAQLRVGMMDSDSRAADVTNQIRNNLTGVADLLRAALGK